MPWLVTGGHGAGCGVEENDVGVGSNGAREVEHVHDRARHCIGGAAADARAVEEDILDEAGDRGLVGDGVIDEVLLRPWRDHQKRQTWSIAATALYGGGAFDARKARGFIAESGSVGGAL